MYLGTLFLTYPLPIGIIYHTSFTPHSTFWVSLPSFLPSFPNTHGMMSCPFRIFPETRNPAQPSSRILLIRHTDIHTGSPPSAKFERCTPTCTHTSPHWHILPFLAL